MKLALTKASDDKFYKEIEVTTVSQLYDLLEEYNCELILSKEVAVETEDGEDYELQNGIIIYDDYIE